MAISKRTFANLTHKIKSAHPIQKFVPNPRERQKPRPAVIQTQRRAGKRNGDKWTLRLIPCYQLRHLLPWLRSHGNDMSRVANAVVHAIDLPRVGHHVESEIEPTTPNVFD